MIFLSPPHSWLERHSDEKNVAVIRAKAFVGASRAILRTVKRNSWLGEHRTEIASQAEIKECLTRHTQELQRDLGEMADEERLGKFLVFLDTPLLDTAEVEYHAFVDDDDADGEEDEAKEEGEQQEAR